MLSLLLCRCVLAVCAGLLVGYEFVVVRAAVSVYRVTGRSKGVLTVFLPMPLAKATSWARRYLTCQ